MCCSKSFFLLLITCLFVNNVFCKVGSDTDYQQRISLCFSQLFQPNLTCYQWAENNFEENGAWYHPNLPNGAIGWEEISQFCSDTRKDFPQSQYLPTVLPSLTHSGPYAYASVDYVFSSNQAEVPFTNWGNVFFALAKNDSSILIHFAVETWTRRVWPNQL